MRKFLYEVRDPWLEFASDENDDGDSEGDDNDDNVDNGNDDDDVIIHEFPIPIIFTNSSKGTPGKISR